MTAPSPAELQTVLRRTLDAIPVSNPGWTALRIAVEMTIDRLEPEREVYTIPVAFDVTGTDREEAARLLAKILFEAPGLQHNPRAECWWMPNDPQADGSDAEAPALHFVTECPKSVAINWMTMRDAIRGYLADGNTSGITRMSWMVGLKARYEQLAGLR